MQILLDGALQFAEDEPEHYTLLPQNKVLLFQPSRSFDLLAFFTETWPGLIANLRMKILYEWN